MINKRNINMYIKQKSTITAFCFLLFFLITLILSFVPSLEIKKGVTDEFIRYDITYMTSNNYSVTYLASKDTLFYSQKKTQTSSLNDFAGIKDLSNAYGDPTSHEYNFIQIKYQFDSKIIDIKGISDDMNGNDGETFILTENGKLYLISQRSEKVQLILDSVKQISVKYETSLRKKLYLVLDKYNQLSIYHFEDNVLIKTDVYNGDISSFYYIKNDNGVHEIIINENNSLYKLTSITTTPEESSYLLSYSYPIYKNNSLIETNKTNLNINVADFVELNDKYYYLYNNEVYKIDLINNSETIKISCEEKINDIYPTGPDAIVAIGESSLYYLGELDGFVDSYDQFVSLNISDGLVYGNRNSLILYKNDRLYLYKDGGFVAMYKRSIVTVVTRFLSIMFVSGTILYIIMSFIEDNKRFNRYFKYHKQ